MSRKNITASERGALLAKESLTERQRLTPIKLEDMERGNRAQRRAAEKQQRKKLK